MKEKCAIKQNDFLTMLYLDSKALTKMNLIVARKTGTNKKLQRRLVQVTDKKENFSTYDSLR